MRIRLLISLTTLMTLAVGCTKQEPASPAPSALENQIRRFAPTVLTGDTGTNWNLPRLCCARPPR